MALATAEPVPRAGNIVVAVQAPRSSNLCGHPPGRPATNIPLGPGQRWPMYRHAQAGVLNVLNDHPAASGQIIK